MTETAALFAALTERLSEIFVENLKNPTPGAPINDQYADGVQRVLSVTEIAAPTWDGPSTCDLEVKYLDDSGGERMYRFVDVTVDDLLMHQDVQVPDHVHSWTLEAP